MAKKSRSLLKILLSIIIFLVLSVLVVGVVLINLTPKQLKLDSIKINNTTIGELGLGKVKLINIYSGFKSLSKTKESSIVANGFNEQTEKSNADVNFDNSSVNRSENYTSILYSPVYYDDVYLIEFNDKTLAFILNDIIINSVDDSNIDFLQKANIQLKELSINQIDSNYSLHVVCKMDITEHAKSIKKDLGFLKNIISIPNVLYLVCDYDIAVSSDGVLQLTGNSITINGKDKPVNNAILEIATKQVSNDALTTDILDKISYLIENVINNLGSVGSARVNDYNVVEGGIFYGVEGLAKNKLYIITNQ